MDPVALPLSWTQINVLRLCALAYRRRYIDRAPELASQPAETGIAFHDITAELEAVTAPGASLDEGLVYRLLQRKAALLAEPAAQDLRFLVQTLVKRGGLPSFPSDVQDRSFERRIAVTAEGKPCSWDDPAALFRGIFDQAWRENGGALAVIGDWKTGRVTHAPGDQLRYYAWLAVCLWPDATEVLGRNFWLRYSARPDGRLFDAAELRATVPGELWAIREDLQRRRRENDWPPRVTDHCRSCSYMASCKAFKSGVSPFVEVRTDADARRTAEELAVLEGQVSLRKKALRAWVAERGALDLSDEEEFGPRPTTRVVATDARLLARALRERGVADESLWAALTLKRSGLASLLWEACRSAEQREALVAELLAAGLVEERTTDGGVRRRKKLPPELEAMGEQDEEEEF